MNGYLGDWIASDFLRERKPELATLRFIALNPRRHVRPLAKENAIVAESDLIDTLMSPKVVARTLLDRQGRQRNPRFQRQGVPRERCR